MASSIAAVSKRALLLLAAVSITVGALSGCGGGSSEDHPSSGGTSVNVGDGSGSSTGSEGPGGPLSKTQFIAAGDAICKRGEEETEIEIQVNGQTWGLVPGKEPTAAQRELLLTVIVLPSIAEQAAKLRRLTPPTGDEEDIEAIIASIERGVEEIEKTPSKGLRAQTPFAPATKLANEYGFKVCGQN